MLVLAISLPLFCREQDIAQTFITFCEYRTHCFFTIRDILFHVRYSQYICSKTPFSEFREKFKPESTVDKKYLLKSDKYFIHSSMNRIYKLFEFALGTSFPTISTARSVRSFMKLLYRASQLVSTNPQTWPFSNWPKLFLHIWICSQRSPDSFQIF